MRALRIAGALALMSAAVIAAVLMQEDDRRSLTASALRLWRRA